MISNDLITESKLVYGNHNNKTDVQAKNFNRNIVFDMKSNNIVVDLSRVDSQSHPEATENLDYIANKMGLNQSNNNKSEYLSTKPLIEQKSPNKTPTISESLTVTQDPESPKPIENHKKVNLMTKILRRLSRPSIFSKERKQKKSKSKDKVPFSDSNRQSMTSDVKSNTISETVNDSPSRSKSVRKMFGRFSIGTKAGKVKKNVMSEAPSIDSRPSVSSAINTAIIGDHCMGSCSDVFVDKLCNDNLEKYNSPSVDCILDHRVGKLLKQEESESSNSEDLRDHEKKLNSSNQQVVSIFNADVSENNNTRDRVTKIDEDKLGPLSVNLNIASWNVDGNRTCHSAMSACSTEASSNVKLTLSLHGYSAYGLSASRFNSKSCMEFRSANISTKSKNSVDNLPMLSDNVTLSHSISHLEDETVITEHPEAPKEADNSKQDVDEEITVLNDIVDSKVIDIREETSMSTNGIALRKSERPTEIQLRRSRVSSQSSMARSSLIMVAVAHNSPRTKGTGSHIGTPTYNPDSPIFPGKKLDFEEDSKAIEEEKMEKIEAERNGNDFLLIANQYETDMMGKIEIVQQYLELYQDKMDEDVIGELNTAVGLAKLLLNEKFVQFRTLCEKNLRETDDGEFQTLSCDLEGYLTTLEIQIENLNKKFTAIDKIRDNSWRMPELCLPVTPSGHLRKKLKPKSAVSEQRNQESRRRIAEFRKMSAAKQGSSSGLLIME